MELETLIAHNQERFCQIGRALKEIRDGRLYKQALFETFEAYIRARWDIGRSQAYRLITSYEVIRNLSPIGDTLFLYHYYFKEKIYENEKVSSNV